MTHLLEQLHKDQRLNPIHEGAEAIYGLDLLCRKVAMNCSSASELYGETVAADIDRIRKFPTLKTLALALETATFELVALLATDPDLALANASLYLDAFGRVSVAWMWLKQAEIAEASLVDKSDNTQVAYYRGKLQTATYYFNWELPPTATQFTLLHRFDRSALDIQPEWLQ